MGDQKRSAGDPLVIRASEWNDMLDAARDHKQRRLLGTPVASAAGHISPAIIRVRNDSGSSRAGFHALEISTHLLAELKRSDLWYSGVCAKGQGRHVAILQRPLTAGEIGPAQVAGVSVAVVDVASTAHRFARVAAGRSCLVSAASGSITLLTQPGSTGQQRLAVLLTGQPPESAPTTTTTPEPSDAPCAGRCKWVWSASSGAWLLDDDGCTPATTTTTAEPPTTTSGEPPTTTTADPCRCSPDDSATTTTTAEPRPCECLYPTFCGSSEGQCTYTFCSDGQVEPSVDCTTTTTADGPPTTTTTCDCEAFLDDLGGGGVDGIEHDCTNCVWYSLPSGGGFAWVRQSGCTSSICTCPMPAAPAEPCLTQITPCELIPPPVPPEPTCSGCCEFWWIPSLSRWVRRLGAPGCPFCFGTLQPCRCTPPSIPGTICAPVQTPCRHVPPPPPPVPTTTTIHPCRFQCAPATTTTTAEPTTTTAGPCDGPCLWEESGGAWSLAENNCDPSCPCAPPPFAPQDDCDVAQTPCGSATTSTTTTEEPPPTTTAEPTTTTEDPPPTTTTEGPCEGTATWRFTEDGTGSGGGCWSLHSQDCEGTCLEGDCLPSDLVISEADMERCDFTHGETRETPCVCREDSPEGPGCCDLGACCQCGDGGRYICDDNVTLSTCNELGGGWHSGQTCEDINPDPCPDPCPCPVDDFCCGAAETGACCQEHAWGFTCTKTCPEICASAGGSFQGAGTDCAEIECGTTTTTAEPTTTTEDPPPTTTTPDTTTSPSDPPPTTTTPDTTTSDE